MPRRIPLQQSNKTNVRMRLPTDFPYCTSVVAYMTYLISNRRAIACALGRVRLTLVTNTQGAMTDSTATEQQNACEKALADRFRASHNRTSIKAHITHLISHRRAGMFAVGCVQLTFVTNRRGTTTFSTATEQQTACEKALADQFRAPHKHQGAQNSPN